LSLWSVLSPSAHSQPSREPPPPPHLSHRRRRRRRRRRSLSFIIIKNFHVSAARLYKYARRGACAHARSHIRFTRACMASPASWNATGALIALKREQEKTGRPTFALRSSTPWPSRLGYRRARGDLGAFRAAFEHRSTSTTIANEKSRCALDTFQTWNRERILFRKFDLGVSLRVRAPSRRVILTIRRKGKGGTNGTRSRGCEGGGGGP